MAMDFDTNSNAEIDKYINKLGGFDDDSSADDLTNDQGDGDGQSGTSATPDNTSAEPAAQAKGKDQTVQGTQPNTDPKASQQPQQGNEGTQKKSLQPIGDGYFADGEGNIVTQDGKVVAERGFASRVFHENKRLKALVETRTNEMNDIARRVGEVEALSRSIKSRNLDNDSVAKALDLAAKYNSGDFLGVAKDVIAMVVAQGYNVTDLLGADVGDTIETRAINQMLEQRLGPIAKRFKDEEQQQEIQRNARAAYDRFVAEHEHAETHADAIAKLAQSRGVTPTQAYNMLYRFAADNGFDFSQSLAPQIEARMSDDDNRAPPAQQTQPAARSGKPLPSPNAGRSPAAAQAVQMADADDDWASIIRQAAAML